MKIKDILNHHKDNIYGGGWDHVTVLSNYSIILGIAGGEYYEILYSLNEILSPESGFFHLDACKNHINGPIEFVTECENDDYVDSFRFEDGDREYNAMRLSILSQEDKIKYLEDNVIVE